jgi:hypothetical protein
MLLIQKANSEVAYALCLYGHQLVDDEKLHSPKVNEGMHQPYLTFNSYYQKLVIIMGTLIE